MTARPEPAARKGAPAAAPVPGVVTEVLPNSMYRVRLERGAEIMAHVAGDLRMSFIRILAGDRVGVEVSPFDSSKGRITARRSASGDSAREQETES